MLLLLPLLVTLTVGVAQVNCEDTTNPSQHQHVWTSSGRVLGITKGDVTRFMGIPYAEQPLGPLRFRRTEALLKDQGTVRRDRNNDEATTIPINSGDSPPAACPQTKHLPEFSHKSIPQGGVRVSEECLKLNVYVPSGDQPRPGEKSVPVLIWIPGEGFNYADSVQYDGSALAASGRIIVVTVNYRVGVFGFMSSGDKTLPGNAGLYDILNAVKWVRRNAEVFGGDSSRLTLGGRFSGAMAVSALVTSPLFIEDPSAKNSKPLVQRVILHDGIATGRYVLDHDPLSALNHLANLTSCLGKDESVESSIACLQLLPSDKLLNESLKVPGLWKPVLNNELLPSDPLSEFNADKYPHGVSLLIGDNNGAGSLCYLTHSFLKTGLLRKIDSNTLTELDLHELTKQSLEEYYTLEEGSVDLAKVAVHEYLYSRDSTPGLPSRRDAFFQLCAAMYIRYPVEFAARSVSRSNRTDVYRYQWSYRPEDSNYPSFLHAAIGEELVFAFPTPDSKFNARDSQASRSMIEVYTNFVRTGLSMGNVSWPKFDTKNKTMLSIGNGFALLDSASLDRDIHFWREAMKPLADTMHSLVQEIKDVRRGRRGGKETCEATVSVPGKSVSSQALLAIVISMGIILLAVVTCFFVKNWGKPRSHWRFL